MTQVLELSDKDFKAAVVCIFHEVRANTLEINGKIDVLRREMGIINKKFRNENQNV